MRFIIVTGMSGAGKSAVVEALEDVGLYCVDNIPPWLIPKFAHLGLNGRTRRTTTGSHWWWMPEGCAAESAARRLSSS